MPILYNQLDVNALAFKPPSKNGLGGQNVYVDAAADSKSNIVFQLPRSRVPFGLDKNEQSQSTRMNMELSIEDAGFVEKILQLDARVLDEAAKNSKAWFGKAYSLQKLKDLEMYRPSITASEKYNPLFRCKVATQGGKVPRIYLLNKEDGKWTPGTLQDIAKGCYVTPIVECQGIWFVGGGKSFGATFLATHILVEKNEADDSFPFLGMSNIAAGGAADVDMQGGDDAYMREIE